MIMAKKIRFPLEMDNGVKVRALSELKENFSLVRAIGYVRDGRLVTWLRDRYEDDIADTIENLDIMESEFPRKLCEIFAVDYNEESIVDMEKLEERNNRLKILREYTDDKEFIDAIDNISFNQDELYELLDDEQSTIYLCGDEFEIPIGKKGVTYIGVNNPVVIVNSQSEVSWSEKDITLKNTRFDSKYQGVIEENSNTENRYRVIRDYTNEHYMNFSLSESDKRKSKELYDKLKLIVQDIEYDDCSDSKDLYERLLSEDVIGCAGKFIQDL